MARPRGFIENWNPKAHVQELVDQVSVIINSSEILPLTLRQIFYIVVSDHGFDKTAKAYKQLCETMNKARRAGLIDMNAIRDDGLTRQCDPGWQSQASFLYSTKNQIESFQLDRQLNQPVKLFLWCEAAGMVPQLVNAVSEYHIPVLSSGGFDSLTSKHSFAEEISTSGEPVMILHLGDHDPSGVHMFGSLDEDLQAFVQHYGGNVAMKRIAVTPDQVRDMGLPTAPPKATDKRSFSGLTTQCEAIPPARLREIVLSEVFQHLDLDIHDETLAREAMIGEELTERFAGLLT